MSNEDLIAIGFEPIKHFTIGNNISYYLGRRRILYGGSIGTPNEMLWICELEQDVPNIIGDSVCIHNYDYDGYITVEKVKQLITALTGRIF